MSKKAEITGKKLFDVALKARIKADGFDLTEGRGWADLYIEQKAGWNAAAEHAHKFYAKKTKGKTK